RGPAPSGPLLHRPRALPLHHAHKRRAQHLPQAEQGGQLMNERVSITQGLSSRRRAYDIVMRTLLSASAAIICALLTFLTGYIHYRGIPSLSCEFLTSEESVINDGQGILPALINTLYIIIATLIFILPLGVGSAI